MGLQALVHSREGINIPDRRSIEPLGAHGLIRWEESRICEGALHHVHEVNSQIEIHPLSTEHVSQTDVHVPHGGTNITQLGFQECLKLLVVV